MNVKERALARRGWWRRELRVSVTGHRDLVPGELGRIESAVRALLGELRERAFNAGYRKFVLQSALAPGADQVVARVALEAGWELQAVLPEDVAAYTGGFEEPNAVEAFHGLRGRARREELVKTPGGKGAVGVYVAVGERLLKKADLVVALWDGIDAGGEGGTACVVREALQPRRRIKEGPQEIWHLAVRRRSNPHPAGEVVDRVVPSGGGPPRTVKDFGWRRMMAEEDHEAADKEALDRYRWRTLAFRCLPVALVLGSVGFGTAGFCRLKGFSGWDGFNHAVGLPILQTNAVEREAGSKLHWTLEVGRAMGIGAAVSTFLLAGYELLWAGIRLRRRRLFGGHAVVCGLGTIGRRLALDLRRRHEGRKGKVVGVDREVSAAVRQWCLAHGMLVVEGDMRDEAVLESVGCRKASKVLWVSRDEKANLRGAGTLSRMLSGQRGSRKKRKKRVKCLVRLESVAGVRALSGAVAGEARCDVEGVDRHAATARGIMAERWIDRFTEARQRRAEVVIVGDGPMADALAMQALRIGFFEPGRLLAVTLFAREPAVAAERFVRTNPAYHVGADGPARLAVEPQWSGVLPAVAFLRMPANDREWLDDGCPLWGMVGADRVTSVYFVEAEGAASVAAARVLLPKLARRRKEGCCDLQSFVYFEHASEGQRARFQHDLNEMVSGLPVFVFSDHMGIGTMEAFEGRGRDRLAKRIALFYECVHGKGEWPDHSPGTGARSLLGDIQRIRQHRASDAAARLEEMGRLIAAGGAATDELADEVWHHLPEEDRDSNRQAADHAPIKWRLHRRRLHEKPGEDPLPVLARVERDRWCAEKLFKGFAPAEGGADKAALRAELRHRDLIPYDSLSDKERDKDMSQVMLIRMFGEGGHG